MQMKRKPPLLKQDPDCQNSKTIVMEIFKTNPTIRQPLFQLGIVLLVFSFGLFVLSDLLTLWEKGESMGAFMLHYACTAVYFFVTLFSGKLKRGRGGLPLVIIFLLLFLISAYALNRQMDVFNASVGWVQVLLVVTSLNLLVASLELSLPFRVKVVQVVLLTLAAVFYTYLVFYLMPVYAFGLLGAIAIGIGLHAFVPALLLVYTLRILAKEAAALRYLRLVSWSVTGISVLVITMYCFRWAMVQSNMEAAYYNAAKPGKARWPAWVDALQTLPGGPVAARVLRSDIVYTVPDFEDGFDFFEAPRIRWEESKKHDPLVVTAALFAGKISIPQEDRIRMLQTIHDERYGAEERLWSGNNLETVHMNSEVQIWPAMHLAYAEKTITVAHKADKQAWRGDQQEAIYIFQLPEGAVVTSLSLWIDGKEEKSILTTKGKAETAYRAIVGVERRDPSVVHWQEGNRVSVRVFPVFANDQRIFKIGITIPLPEREGKIWFENITFTGPSAENATENLVVRLMGADDTTVQAVALKKQGQNTYTYKGKYRPGLSLALPANPLARHAFVHKGKAFMAEQYVPVKAPKHFGTLYADLNEAWTHTEWEQLLSAASGRQMFVYDEGWIKVDRLNQTEIFEKLRQRRLTVFPFYEIADPEGSLVITKTAGNTPTLGDLRKSSGFDALAACAEQAKRFYVFHIGEQPSRYLSSLRELRLFHYSQGPFSGLIADLNRQVFDADIESETTSVLYNAGMKITATDDTSVSNAPDHLLRLFAYNHILQQGGLRLLADSSLQESRLADIASYAHIVSPVSSMIVLESKEDYERFGIDESKEGLKNASAQNNGSVPEPHEWAIMLVCLVLLACYRFQHKINVAWLRK